MYKLLAILFAVALALGVSVPALSAQSPAPTLEGQTCVATSYWFADGYVRPATGGKSPQAAIQAYLVLFSPMDQTATVTARVMGAPAVVRQVTLTGGAPVSIDMGALIGRTSANFATEVEFSGIAVADLKMWQAGQTTPVIGLPLCR